MRHTATICAIALALTALSVPQPAAADGRHRTEVRSSLPPQLLLPAAAAPEELSAPILSGLDYSAVAPPGVRLRIIEDEPYTYVLGAAGNGRLALGESVTSLTLRADIPAIDGVPLGFYEARISLRLAGARGANGALARAFHAAAHSAYRHAMLENEERGEIVYNLDEVRSPLGLTEAKDRLNHWREYFAYAAVAINPNSADGAVRATPYQYISGQLRALRLVDRHECLLTVAVEAQEFPHALTLTENIARCIVNRLLNPAQPDQRLTYLAYYPETEQAVLFDNDVLDPRVADLAERPGEGCGVEPMLIQGDLCPQCTESQPVWPARPYADRANLHKLAQDIAAAVCSHCLLGPQMDGLSTDAPPVQHGDDAIGNHPCEHE